MTENKIQTEIKCFIILEFIQRFEKLNEKHDVKLKREIKE